MPPSYFDASGTSNVMFDELAERPLMSPLAGMKHAYVRLAIVIFFHTCCIPSQMVFLCFPKNNALLRSTKTAERIQVLFLPPSAVFLVLKRALIATIFKEKIQLNTILVNNYKFGEKNSIKVNQVPIVFFFSATVFMLYSWYVCSQSELTGIYKTC